MHNHRMRGPVTATSAGALAAAGILFAAYPALRPYPDQSPLALAQGMASPAWVAAHTSAMMAFLTLTLGLWALAHSHVPGRGPAMAAGLAWAGSGLVLPYYGVETFGAHVIAGRAVAESDPSLVSLVDQFRYGPVALSMFGVGLLTLGAAGVALTVSLWRAGGVTRAAGVLVGLGLLAYLPQFFAAPGLRIGHGLVLGTGCVLLAVTAARRPADVASAQRRAPLAEV